MTTRNGSRNCGNSRSTAGNRDNNRIVLTVQTTLLVALGAACGVATAQDGVDAPIEEIVVTATRREQAFRDVPLAISALDSQRLLDAGITEFNDIQSQVPSLEIEANTNPFTTSLRIRGVGNLANIPNFEPAVGLFVDGAYRSRSGVAMGDLLDVARIEILRGPQSVLYPKNVTAGVVSIITQRPKQEFGAWGGASFGNLNYWQLQGGINGALTDGVLGRLSVVRSDREGGFSDTVNRTQSGGFTRTGARGQLEFDLGDRSNLRLVAGFSDKKGDCCSPDVLSGAVSTSFLGLLGRPVDRDPLNRRTTYSDPYNFDGNQYDLLAEFNYEFAGAVLTSTTSYDHFKVRSQIDSEQSAFTAAVFIDRQKSTAFGQEFRLTSKGNGPVSWMTGAYYYDNDFTRGSLAPSEPILVLGPDVVPLPAPFNGAAGDQSSFQSLNDTRHWSLFGQLDWQATERMKLSAGLRYIDETKSIDVRSNFRVAALPSLALNTTVPTPILAKRSTDGLAWNVNALFDVAPSATIYANASKGYKAGGYNGDWDASGALTATRREFRDESVLNLEAGIKSRFGRNNQATLNLSVFRSKFDDFQNASFLGLNFLVRNAEQVVTQGIELDGSVRPFTGVIIDYAATYLDAQYDTFTQGPCFFGRAPTNAAERTCNLSGATLPNAPKLRTDLGLQFERPVAAGTGFFRMDWAYSSDQLVDAGLDPRSKQGAYSLISARMGWRNERVSVSLWGDNLTDKTVMSAAGPQTIFGGIDGGLQLFLNEPRTYGVTVDVHF